MSIIDDNARWEDEDKAMAEMLDSLPTAEQEAEWGQQINAEIDQMQQDMAAEYQAHLREELTQDVFEALERYLEKGDGFTRTTLADFMWDIYTQIDRSASVQVPKEAQRQVDYYMEDGWLDSSMEE